MTLDGSRRVYDLNEVRHPSRRKAEEAKRPLTQGERDQKIADGLNKRATAEQRNEQPGQSDAPPGQETPPEDEEVTG